MAENIPRIAAPLMADLEKPAGFLRGLHHLSSTLQSVGHLFFAIDVQTGFKAGHSVVRVPEVGGGNYDCIEVFLPVEHLLVIRVVIVLVAISSQSARDPFSIVRPDITYGLEANTGDSSTGLHKNLTLLAGTEQGHVYIVPLLAAVWLRKGPLRKRQPGARRRSRMQEVTSVEFLSIETLFATFLV